MKTTYQVIYIDPNGNKTSIGFGDATSAVNYAQGMLAGIVLTNPNEYWNEFLYSDILVMLANSKKAVVGYEVKAFNEHRKSKRIDIEAINR